MKTDFVDFWSANRWLCQYNVVIEENCQWIDEAIIVHSLAETPYRATDKFKYWHPDRLHQWLLKLDENTVKLCTFQQQWKSGRICPAFEYILFPCPDGFYYAGYPAANPIYYIRAFDFRPSTYFYGTPKEREEKMQSWWLDRGQETIESTARRLWRKRVAIGELVMPGEKPLEFFRSLTGKGVAIDTPCCSSIIQHPCENFTAIFP